MHTCSTAWSDELQQRTGTCEHECLGEHRGWGKACPGSDPRRVLMEGQRCKPQGYKLGGSTPKSSPRGLSRDSSPVEHRIGEAVRAGSERAPAAWGGNQAPDALLQVW